MVGRRWTAALAVAVVAAGCWLAVIPYHQRIALGRLPLSGQCPSAVRAAFTRVPENPFYDLGSGDGLPVELCVRSARRRLTLGIGVALTGAAVAVAGRTAWRRQADDG